MWELSLQPYHLTLEEEEKCRTSLGFSCAEAF